MKAVVLTPEGEKQLEDRARPSPSSGQILLAVGACGICGSDLKATPSPNPGAYKANVILGHEFAGTVVEVADDVTSVDLGQLVVANVMALSCGECVSCRRGLTNQCLNALERSSGFTHDGAMAEFVTIPERYAHPVPPAIDARIAAWTEPLAAAVRGIRLGEVRHAASVAILGAGSVGQLVLQLAMAAGAGEILVIEPSAYRRNVASQQGATQVCTPDDADEVDTLYDVVFECSGSTDAIDTALELVAPGGRVVLIGGYGPDYQIRPGRAPGREASLHFSMTYRDSYEFATALRLLSRGVVDVTALTTEVLPLSRFEDAFNRMRDSEGALKLMVDPSME